MGDIDMMQKTPCFTVAICLSVQEILSVMLVNTHEKIGIIYLHISNYPQQNLY